MRAPIEKTGEKTTRYRDNTGHRWYFIFIQHHSLARVYGLFGWQPATHSGCPADVCMLQHGSDCVFGWLDRTKLLPVIKRRLALVK